ncbi:hypothetical protein ECH_0565 [Ehrlichia chaffeensis str. Arkansas]|uniref:Uncharacterized protein n=1 Tax=Ehrlichia chaffeensis (strain ATCC CRL-10679 / Arkansas) TaxID=205920 RepID=Q2GGQ6_EHRCR|nr:hypothetical protein ECH_0565 [Ehrlichia chaffeensis str. Arkansas]
MHSAAAGIKSNILEYSKKEYYYIHCFTFFSYYIYSFSNYRKSRLLSRS